MRHSLLLLLVVFVLLPAASFAFEEDDDFPQNDRFRFSVFVQPGISFLGFGDRDKFQNALDTLYYKYKAEALTAAESLQVTKQDFQKVNFAFPVSFGIQFQPFDDHFISAGAGYLYDNESVIISDRKNKNHNYHYTLQGIPFFLEYRLGISPNLISISNQSLFSIAVRWYWMLPGTEIYSSWGQLKGKSDFKGNGFGISLGYLITSWKNFSIFGDLGYSSITIKSDEPFSKVVPDTSTKKASWSLGGIQLQIRVAFGVIAKPVPEIPLEEETAEMAAPENIKETPEELKTEPIKEEAPEEVLP
ncbi:MAG: hypothetical protein LBR60_01140 [Fibrobacter sp.]|jgi:hypothetical protein|nr:hypothetical protein [Fibrobacter sp.]